MTPLAVWMCDTCGDDIVDPGMALVSWRTDDDGRGYDFRIVHNNFDGRHCDPGAEGGFVLSTELSSFLGADGLAYVCFAGGHLVGDGDAGTVG